VQELNEKKETPSLMSLLWNGLFIRLFSLVGLSLWVLFVVIASGAKQIEDSTNSI
jgi:hypothetical protein